MQADTYLTIKEPAEGLFKDKGSKFFAYAFPVKNEEQIKQHLSSLKKEHHSARHHCYAYMLGPNQKLFRANDDGEPSNTAGKPILGQIQSNNLTDILIIVVRYFGGTLLGVGGLINAYRNAAAEAIDNATVSEEIIKVGFKLNFSYELMNSVMKLIKDYDLEIKGQCFEMHCQMTIAVRESMAETVEQKLTDIRDLLFEKK